MKRQKTEAYTYLNVCIGKLEKFDLDDFCTKLNLDAQQIDIKEPTPIIDKASYPENKRSYEARFQLGLNQEFNIDINEMARQTIAPFVGKEKTIHELSQKYDLQIFLERVLQVTAKEICPVLNLDPDIINFLYASGVQDDLDLYVI